MSFGGKQRRGEFAISHFAVALSRFIILLEFFLIGSVCFFYHELNCRLR
jgi:hypothetical protein